MEGLKLKQIAVIRTGFPEKFGIPRQSGLAPVLGRIVFEPEYRNPDALRGIEQYSHLWVIWGFSLLQEDGWRPTVRPPRLGGNRRMGVFATRSPFRPNPIGLSCVELVGLKQTEREGQVLLVKGVDMADGSPVYDIKPYLPYVDVKPLAEGGFGEQLREKELQVEIPIGLEKAVPEEHRETIRKILSQDPRPSYQDDEDRVYGMAYEGMEVRFQVKGKRLIVCGICRE